MDTKKLREMAEAATPGPWTSDTEQQGKGRSSYRVLDADGMWVADCDGADHDAAFIAAANPQAVIALLDEVAGWRKAYEISESNADRNAASLAKLDAILDRNEALVEQLAAMTKARDEACDAAINFRDGLPVTVSIAALRKVGTP